MKKIFSLIIAVSILISASALPICAVDTSSAEKNLKLLSAFGIINGTELENGADEVKRNEFAKYITAINGIDADTLAAETASLPFTDVKSDDKYYKFIYSVYTAGYMNGTSANTFSPDESVTQMQAAKAILKAFGYDIMAERRGGYPNGYAAAAAEIGIFSGLSDEKAITAEETAKLLVKALNTDLLQYESFGENISMKTKKGETLLTERLKIHKDKGIVEADYYSGLFSAKSGLSRGYIKIADKLCICSAETADGMLGRNVEFYFREDDDDDTVVYIETIDECTAIDAEDIVTADISEIVYTENDKKKTKNIPTNALFIYNGKYAQPTQEKLNPKQGIVELIDNNDDGITDIVKVTEYKTVVADSASAATNILYGKGGEKISLSADDCDVTYLKNGAGSSVSQIKEWNVLSCVFSSGEGKNFKKIYISDKKYTGTIEGIAEDNVTVNKNTVPIHDFALNEVYVGFEGTLYADVFGKIAAADGARDDVYGYVTKTAISPLDEAEMRIFTENGRWVTLKLKSRLKFNGDGKTAKAVYEKVSPNTLVRYSVNGERLIYELNTAKTYERNSSEESEAIALDKFRLAYEGNSLQYRNTFNGFGENMGIAGDAKIFNVPAVSEDYDEADFSVTGYSALVADGKYNVKAYDADENLIADVCVVTDVNESKIDNAAGVRDVMLVKKVTDGVNDEGDNVYIIYGMYKSNDYMLYTKDLSVVNKLESVPQGGDVIQINLNDDGYIEDINPVYSAKNGAEQKFISAAVYKDCTFFAGEVLGNNISEGKCSISYSDGTSFLGRTGTVRRVYIYDPEKKIMKRGSLSDVSKGDYIFGGMRYQQISEIIIFKSIF